MKVKTGDVKMLVNPRGKDFKVRVVHVFENGEWAMVELIGFEGCSREVMTNQLY